MQTYGHGGDIYGIGRPVLDYSININPLGMPEAVKEAIRAHIDEYERYPDTHCRALRAAIAAEDGVPAEDILCGNGASDLIWRICRTVKPGKTLVCAPTFSDYERDARSAGSEMVYHKLLPEEGFRVTERFLDDITEETGLVFLCNPNNPNGLTVPDDFLEKAAERCARCGAVLVIDECFLCFTGRASFAGRLYADYKPLPGGKKAGNKQPAGNEAHTGTITKTDASSRPSWTENAVRPANDASGKEGRPDWADHVILLNAFTKKYSMAGIRLGYLVCRNRELLSRIEENGPYWSVSTVAQEAGIAALGCGSWFAESLGLIRAEWEYLAEGLRSLGFTVFPGEANYLLFRDEKEAAEAADHVARAQAGANEAAEPADAGKAAEEKETSTQACISLNDRLLARDILVRSCSNYQGLTEGYYRICVMKHAENEHFLAVLSDVMKETR